MRVIGGGVGGSFSSRSSIIYFLLGIIVVCVIDFLKLDLTIFIDNDNYENYYNIQQQVDEQHDNDLYRFDDTDSSSASSSSFSSSSAFSLQMNLSSDGSIVEEEEKDDDDDKEDGMIMTMERLDPIQIFEEWKTYHSVDAVRESVRKLEENNNKKNKKNENKKDDSVSDGISLLDSIDHNKFIMVYFSCPHQAGVQIIDMLHSVLFAIIMNRTILFQYSNFNRWMITGENSIQQCNRLLTLNTNWIPQYQEFKHYLPHQKQHAQHGPPYNNTNINHTVLAYEFEKPYALKYQKYQDEYVKNGNTSLGNTLFLSEDVSQYPILDIKRIWSQRFLFGKLLNLMDPYISTIFSQSFGIIRPQQQQQQQQNQPPQQQQQQQQLLHEQKRIQMLYREGTAFLLGMIFHEMYSFADELLDSVRDDIVSSTTSSSSLSSSSSSNHVDDHNHNDNEDDNVFSIALHSRHATSKEDGTEIYKETTCIDMLFYKYYYNTHNTTHNKNKKNNNYYYYKSCALYIMSDRTATVQLVSKYVEQKYNCTTHSVSKPMYVNTTRAHYEHGPYAGSGYFQDLVVVTGNHNDNNHNHHRGKSAYISNFRSSSLVPYILIEYHRKIQHWKKQNKKKYNDNNNNNNNNNQNHQHYSSSSILDDIPYCHLKSITGKKYIRMNNGTKFDQYLHILGGGRRNDETSDGKQQQQDNDGDNNDDDDETEQERHSSDE